MVKTALLLRSSLLHLCMVDVDGLATTRKSTQEKKIQYPQLRLIISDGKLKKNPNLPVVTTANQHLKNVENPIITLSCSIQLNNLRRTARIQYQSECYTSASEPNFN